MNFNPTFPDLKFCGDNAAMIALGLEDLKKTYDNASTAVAKSRWLPKSAPFMKGLA